MHTDPQAEYIAALIDLHRGLDRQGPGDTDFSRGILRGLPPLPPTAHIADLGCGGGAGALLLAQHYQCHVTAVDASSVFIETLRRRAKEAGLNHLITPLVADMAALDWPSASVNLLWSEGAAYTLGFERALGSWRPLLVHDGIAVISEMSWFTDKPPEPALAYWQAAYPTMGSESRNIARARGAGYEVIATKRLPSELWWRNYYDPLRTRLEQAREIPINQEVVRETEAEMALFEKFSRFYGYTFFILRAKNQTNDAPSGASGR
jgi:ubiquinone/menaquinone biosynthesis C-methylase UbiE